jgi:hypothetical protein
VDFENNPFKGLYPML